MTDLAALRKRLAIEATHQYFVQGRGSITDIIDAALQQYAVAYAKALLEREPTEVACVIGAHSIAVGCDVIYPDQAKEVWKAMAAELAKGLE